MNKWVKQHVIYAALLASLIVSPAGYAHITTEHRDPHDLVVRHIFASAKSIKECDDNHETCHKRYCRYVYSRYKASCFALCEKWHKVCKQNVVATKPESTDNTLGHQETDDPKKKLIAKQQSF